MEEKYFYITTTLPYVNAEPHIGFAWEIVEADVIARYQRLLGKAVIFNTGTDEHGQKIFQKSQEAGMEVQDYVDHFAAKFSDLKKILNLSYDHFIRTTDPNHVAAAQEFWKRCKKNGDIYKKLYLTKYCVGCELEKTDSELDDGKCPLHPNKNLELIEEENYFFRFSAYGKKLLQHYQQHPDFVKPSGKLKEITSFVENGLNDFSISRLKEKMPWGIEVPDDPEHVMYVWFDALINYISTLGWPEDQESFGRFWPGIQLAGKDNLRQQSAMWQAMLLSAQLPLSNQILINGFISIDGQKMSKSLGNVIAPAEMVERYGIDATRFLLISLGTFGSDADVTWEKLDTTYTAELCNGLGNLCSRIAKMCEKYQVRNPHKLNSENQIISKITPFHTYMDRFDLTLALRTIWGTNQEIGGETKTVSIEEINKKLSEDKPWKMEPSTAAEYLIQETIPALLSVASQIQAFLPDTAQTILDHFTQPTISALVPFFPRLENRQQ